ncbi:MAG: FlgD immunoglobulin-like domain containing protein [bacterium]|nr:FlgD immunoglobulin-like domain containing protein [bacterium]
MKMSLFAILIFVVLLHGIVFADSWLTGPPMPTARCDAAIATVNNKIYVLGGFAWDELTVVEEYDPAYGTWVTKASMPYPTCGVGVSVVGSKIYIMGGTCPARGSVNDEYDPSTDSWIEKNPMPTRHVACAVAEVGSKIYAIGGYLNPNYYNINEEYDPATNSWTIKAPMPTAREYLVAGVINGRIYAIGGWNHTAGGVQSANEEYNPVTNTWITKTPMLTPRFGMAAAVVGDKIYVIGGRDATHHPVGTNEVWDGTGWSTKSPMPTPRMNLGASAVGSKIYAIGGWDSDNYLATNEEYNTETDEWITWTPMSTPRSNLAVVTFGTKIYAIGGYGTTANEEYDTETDRWNTKSSTISPINYARAAVVNSKIYVIGDNPEFFTSKYNNEYDPITDTWTSKSLMLTPRFSPTAAAINDKIYVVGGVYWDPEVEISYLNINEEYDPLTDTWARKVPMPTRRAYMGAAVVNDKMYVIGGGREASVTLTTNEEYDPSTSTWTTKAPMTKKRRGVAVAAVNNRVYAIGGSYMDENGEIRYLDINEEYNPETNTWATKTPMPTKRSTDCVTAPRLPGGPLKIHVIGGVNDTAYLGTNEEYTPDIYGVDEISPAIYANELSVIPSVGTGEFKIMYSIKTADKVSLKVYDASGRLIYTLFDGLLSAGSYHTLWNTTDAAGVYVNSGVYFLKLLVGNPIHRSLRTEYDKTEKIIVVK